MECLTAQNERKIRLLAEAAKRWKSRCMKSGKLIQRIAGQKPEKPDYWNSCHQCEENINDAQDVLEETK
jgi:hypothetical protein